MVFKHTRRREVTTAKYISGKIMDVPTLESTLSHLTHYMEMGEPFTRDLRREQVKAFIKAMIDEGRVIYGTPRYSRIRKFYLETFGEEPPCFVTGHVTYQRNS